MWSFIPRINRNNKIYSEIPSLSDAENYISSVLAIIQFENAVVGFILSNRLHLAVLWEEYFRAQ